MTERVSDHPKDEDEVKGEEKHEDAFDFSEHRRKAVDDYLRVRPQYQALSAAVRNILIQALKARDIKVNSVEARAKNPESFGSKAETPSEDDPGEPKYPDPLQDITDLAGIRIITFFPRTVNEIADCIRAELDILEHMDLSRTLLKEERFGYRSEHFLVRLSDSRTSLPEYEPYRGLVAEIQVRTILQHAWAEIEHDIQYKSSITTPESVRRRFMSLAGLLEIADREFQAIQDEDNSLKQRARTSVEEGSLDQVEITADALRSYLDKRIGPDARVSEFSYEWTARALRRLGFTTIHQLEKCIEGYDDDELSRIAWGRRQGPIMRLSDMLLAGMGSVFIERGTNDSDWRDVLNKKLAKFKEHGISLREFDPQTEVISKVQE